MDVVGLRAADAVRCETCRMNIRAGARQYDAVDDSSNAPMSVMSGDRQHQRQRTGDFGDRAQDCALRPSASGIDFRRDRRFAISHRPRPLIANIPLPSSCAKGSWLGHDSRRSCLRADGGSMSGGFRGPALLFSREDLPGIDRLRSGRASRLKRDGGRIWPPIPPRQFRLESARDRLAQHTAEIDRPIPIWHHFDGKVTSGDSPFPATASSIIGQRRARGTGIGRIGEGDENRDQRALHRHRCRSAGSSR